MMTDSSILARGTDGRDLRRLSERLDGVFDQMAGSELLITGSAEFRGHYLVMTPRRDQTVSNAFDTADLTTPAGMPLVWIMRRRGHHERSRVPSPDLMEFPLPYGVPHEWWHFCFGANQQTSDLLQAKAQRLAPDAQIAACQAPPFRPRTTAEEDEVVDEIRASDAHLVHVGLGMPKQEMRMHRVQERLPSVSLMSMAATFDLLTATVPQAPGWLHDRGLESVYRPWRGISLLWRRYAINNPVFAVLAFIEPTCLRRHVRRRG